MNKNSPKVSVIIPVYNVEQYLEQCLESVVNQTLKEIEIILINDGTKDNSVQICEKFAKQDPRINFVQQENKGLSATRNVGLKLAKGEFVAFLDSDDWVDLDFYEKLYKAAVETNAEIAAAGFERYRKFYRRHRLKFSKQKVITDRQEKIGALKIPRYCYVWNKIYKKDALEKSGITFREGVYYEDMEFTMRIIGEMGSIATTPKTIYHYRANPKSIVKTTSTKKCVDYSSARDMMHNLAREYGVKFDKRGSILNKKAYKIFGIPIINIKYWECETRYYLFNWIEFLEIKRRV